MMCKLAFVCGIILYGRCRLAIKVNRAPQSFCLIITFHDELLQNFDICDIVLG